MSANGTGAADVVVVGGGLLGGSVAYHLARRGVRVALVDRGPEGLGASAGNFGLVWVQDKAPVPYLALTMRSAERWPAFAQALRELAGLDVEHERPGGLHFCLDEAALAARAAFLAGQARIAGFRHEILDADGIRRLEPAVGPAVVGGSYSPLDGHANPLLVVRALQRSVERLGGRVCRGFHVGRIRPAGPGRWAVDADRGRFEAGAVVLTAGAAIPRLAEPLGLDVPVRPQRGQVLVSEVLPPVLRHPSVPVRQGRSGTLFIGGTHEEVGFDPRTTAEGIAAVAVGALRIFPWLGRVRAIRAWGGLRPLTPDGLPVLEQPATHPGLFVATAHSGVTLCPAIGEAMAEWVATGRRPDWLPVYETARFREGPTSAAVAATRGE